MEALFWTLGVTCIALGMPVDGLLGAGLSILGVALVWAAFFLSTRRPQ